MIAVCLVLFAFFCSCAEAADRPNILWITSEDHGPHLGCYGDTIARTPNIDALARRGMIFNRAWSCAPVCAPARTAIITGLYPSSSGGLHMRSMVSLPPNITLFPKLLRDAGYYCSNNSKEDYNVHKPDGVWDESSAKSHWQNRPQAMPFFSVFNSTNSHESRLRGREFNLITDPNMVRVPDYHPDTPEVRRDWARYYDIVSEADADAGRHLQEIETAGLAEDTIIFYFSDHGSGMPRNKRWPSNSGLQVPFVVYFPERWRHLAPREYQSGGRSDRLINFVDLAPTMLSLVGIQPPTWMQGHPFAGQYQSEPQKFMFGERGRMDERLDLVRSVTDGRFVYLRNYFPHVSQGQHLTYQFQTPTTRIWRELFDQGLTNDAQSQFWRVPKAPEELFDLQTDRDEVRNLATSTEYQRILETLRDVQRKHAATIRDVCLLPEGEIHVRSVGGTPYEIARDDVKYPFERIRVTAELAAGFDCSALPELTNRLTDTDSAVRYWAALGFLIRGGDAVTNANEELRQSLKDESPFVRIVAAQTLGQYGTDSDRPGALKTLEAAAQARNNGVLVAVYALNAIDALGSKADSIRERIRTLEPKRPSPDVRYDEYVPRLIKLVSGR